MCPIDVYSGKINILEKELLIIPFLNKQIWNLIIIQNISGIIKSDITNKTLIKKSLLNLICFDKHQSSNKELIQQILEEFENFIKFYSKIKYENDQSISIINKELSLNSFDQNIIILNRLNFDI